MGLEGCKKRQWRWIIGSSSLQIIRIPVSLLGFHRPQKRTLRKTRLDSDKAYMKVLDGVRKDHCRRALHRPCSVLCNAGWDPSTKVPVQVGDACIVFACTVAGNHFLRRWV